jgi:hypothetical protein
LAQEALFILGEDIQLVDFGDAVRKKFLGKIELPPPDDIFVNIPADFFRYFDAFFYENVSEPRILKVFYAWSARGKFSDEPTVCCP